MTRECVRCGRRFTPKPGPGRPRQRCFDCKPTEDRRDRQPSLSAPAPVSILEKLPQTGLVATITAELHAAGRENTAEGVLALRLAGMLADGGHTASGAAALSRELRATLADALKGANMSADSLDELAQRRALRVSGG